ncbi:hypothetical protein DM52_1008 [Burkholderia mallei]|nr:hypothetical protein DM52_1008 [Burkholderia mallei]
MALSKGAGQQFCGLGSNAIETQQKSFGDMCAISISW